MTTPKHRFGYLFLTLITLMVYWQVRDHEFINFDDDTYVSDNPNIKNGLTWKSIGWAFSADLVYDSPNADYWQPVTFLSRIMDIQLFGLNPSMHHLMNLAFHVANVLLLFHVLRRMTTLGGWRATRCGGQATPAGEWQDGAVKRSAAVAALFAIHPLQVESVAWVTERKDVLSGLFWMLTLWAYICYVETPDRRRYAAVLLLFALGLMSKPMVVTLPFVLLLLDGWPLGRWGEAGRWTMVDGRSSRNCGSQIMDHGPWTVDSGQVSTWVRLLLEKLPLFALSMASIAVTLPFQHQVLEHPSARNAIAHAAMSYSKYCWKIVYPHDLAIHYPSWGGNLSMGQVFGACAFAAGCTFCVIRWGWKRPYLFVGWLWFIGTLAPVVALNDIATADRFTYLPSIGIFMMAAWGIPELLSGWRYRDWGLRVGFGAALVFLMMASWIQVDFWRNSITVFERALEVTTDNAVAHFNLGNALADQGNLDEAIRHFRESLRIHEQDARTRYNLANALSKQGMAEEAIAHYAQVLRMDPGFEKIHNNLANALTMRGRFAEAVENYRLALKVKPDHVEARYNLGVCLAKQGRTEEAITCMKQTLEQRPDFAPAQRMLESFMRRPRLSEPLPPPGATSRSFHELPKKAVSKQ